MASSIRILVCGKDGSGKTTLATRLAKLLDAVHLNADAVRSIVQDADFSVVGRLRQASRMSLIATHEESNQKRDVIGDFICPTEETRKIFGADFVVFLNTAKSKHEDTEQLFVPPVNPDCEFTEFPSNTDITTLAEQIAMFAGRRSSDEEAAVRAYYSRDIQIWEDIS